MYSALDRISEDDDAAAQPVNVWVYLSGTEGMVRVFGLDPLFELTGGTSLDAVRRFVQRHLDNLRNSEAAIFLRTNRACDRGNSPCVTVRVPRAVAEALDAEAAE